MVDFFVPNENEEELLNIVGAGSKDIIFLYSMGDFKSAKVANKGILLKEKYTLNDIFKAQRLAKNVVVKYNDNIRMILEKTKRIIIYGCENENKLDFIHHRNSGLNHILLAIAKKNRIRFLFNFKDFLSLTDNRKAIVLGRLKQNIMLYKKYKVMFNFASFATDKYEIKKDYSSLQKLLESNKIE